MGMHIPPKPPPFTEKPGEHNPEYDAHFLEHQKAMFEYQQAVQNAQAAMNQEFQMASNVRKSADEAIDAMIRNLA